MQTLKCCLAMVGGGVIGVVGRGVEGRWTLKTLRRKGCFGNGGIGTQTRRAHFLLTWIYLYEVTS